MKVNKRRKMKKEKKMKSKVKSSEKTIDKNQKPIKWECSMILQMTRMMINFL